MKFGSTVRNMGPAATTRCISHCAQYAEKIGLDLNSENYGRALAIDLEDENEMNLFMALVEKSEELGGDITFDEFKATFGVHGIKLSREDFDTYNNFRDQFVAFHQAFVAKGYKFLKLTG